MTQNVNSKLTISILIKIPTDENASFSSEKFGHAGSKAAPGTSYKNNFSIKTLSCFWKRKKNYRFKQLP